MQPDPPLDDLLQKTPKMEGTLTVKISGAKGLRQATTWFSKTTEKNGAVAVAGAKESGAKDAPVSIGISLLLSTPNAKNLEYCTLPKYYRSYIGFIAFESPLLLPSTFVRQKITSLVNLPYLHFLDSAPRPSNQRLIKYDKKTAASDAAKIARDSGKVGLSYFSSLFRINLFCITFYDHLTPRDTTTRMTVCTHLVIFVPHPNPNRI
jgi:hypothetical protein